MKRTGMAVLILNAVIFWIMGTDIPTQKQTEAKQVEFITIDWDRLAREKNLDKPFLDKVRDIKAVVRQCREQQKFTAEKREQRESWLLQMFKQDLEAGIPISDLMRLQIESDRQEKETLDLAYSEYLSRQKGIYPQDSSVTTSFLMLISQIPGIEELMTLLSDEASFHQLYWMAPFRLNDSYVVSRAQLLLAALTDASDEEFKSRTANKTFSPHDIAFALRTPNFSEQRLIWLLDLAVDLEDKPLFIAMNGILPTLNLADDAIQRLDVSSLKILKRYGVTPTNIVGAMTGLDIALSQQEGDAQKVMIDYLIDEGYRAHLLRVDEYDDGIKIWTLGSQYYSYSSSDEDLMQAIEERTPFITANTPDIGYAPSPDTAASELIKMKSAKAQELQKCYAQEIKLSELEQVIPTLEQYNILEALPIDEPFERVIAEAQTLDPVLADMYANRYPDSERDFTNNSDLSSHFKLAEESVEEMTSFVSNHTLSSRYLTRLLGLIVYKPEFTAAWLQVTEQSHLTSLQPLKTFRCGRWQTLREQGFNFNLTDNKHRNLYSIAFSCGPESVDLLINFGVPALSQPYGSDALDLALDDTYVNERLHPSLQRILKQTHQVETSHSARMARLRLFQPKLYADIIAMKPELSVTPEQKLNSLINNS